MATITKRNRVLTNNDDVFSQNAWDNIEWTEDMTIEAQRRIQEQKEGSSNCPENIESNVERQVGPNWDKFYENHGDKFFKDRLWFASEFPELFERLGADSGPIRLLEIGCGVGNSVASIFKTNSNSQLYVYCCDISQKAIDSLRKRTFYQEHRDMIDPFQADICNEFDKIKARIKESSLDFITVIFTLSAIKPELMGQTVKNLASLLGKDGMILFRDYARYDMTQLRFKPKSYLREDYYVRSDGTTSYFFAPTFVNNLFTEAGLTKIELSEDNRLLVNRLKSLTMCRRWIQAKYVKKC